jgi:hypothetical protein
MMTAEEIIEMMVETEEWFSSQDNREAAKIARIMRELIERARGPSIEDLRKKFLGDEV